MIKKLFGLAMILVVASCNEPQVTSNESAAVNDINVIDGRLVFKSAEAYHQAIDDIGTGKGNELILSLRKLRYSSLNERLNRAYKLEMVPDDLRQFERYDYPHQLLLNSDGIVQIGNDVVKYDNGVKYYQDVKEFGTSDITKSERTGSYQLTVYSAADGDGASRALSTHLDRQPDASGGNQYDYFTLGDGSHRKYIHEWIGSLDTDNWVDCQNYTYARLYLWIKMEGRPNGNKPWKIANEPRRLSWDLSISPLSLVYYTAGCASPVYNVQSFGTVTTSQVPYIENNGNYNFQIASTYKHLNVFYTKYSGEWTGEITGYIQHEYWYNGASLFTWNDPM